MNNKCNKCGKDLEFKSQKVTGISIKISGLTNPNSDSIRNSLGKYEPDIKADEIEFDFCYECWLDSLFGI